MEIVVVIARLFVALVFLIAGVAKMRDQKGFFEALRDFGMSAPLARPLTILIPVFELAVATALIIPVGARYGEAAAVLLLLAFFGGVAISLAHGNQPECHCFGRLKSARVGWVTLARIALLATLTAWLAIRRLRGWVGYSWPLIPLSLALVAWITRQWSKPIKGWPAGTGAGLPVNTSAPEFTLPDLDGRRHSLASLLWEGKPVLLLFIDPDCGPCTFVLQHVAERAAACRVIVLSRGSASENRAKIAPYGFTVLLQNDAEVAEAYDCPGGPAAILISPEGHILSGLAMGARAIQQLLCDLVTAHS